MGRGPVEKRGGLKEGKSLKKMGKRRRWRTERSFPHGIAKENALRTSSHHERGEAETRKKRIKHGGQSSGHQGLL